MREFSTADSSEVSLSVNIFSVRYKASIAISFNILSAAIVDFKPKTQRLKLITEIIFR